MTSEAVRFWTERDPAAKTASSNASLFRFFGQSGFNFDGRAVLEIGFGHGADLLEAQRRGAKIWGIDINRNSVERMRQRTGLDTFVEADASKWPFDFGIRFDAIYSRDTIYYLSDAELATYARHCLAALAPEGRIVVHFIEADYVRQEIPRDQAAAVGPESWRRLETAITPDNPIRILDARVVTALFEAEGAQLIGRKTLQETYGTEEAHLRCQRYLMFGRR